MPKGKPAKRQRGWPGWGRYLGLTKEARDEDVTQYNGSCHCGRVRFRLSTQLDNVVVCDCSICRKRGALIHKVEDGALEILTPLDELTTYKFHSNVATDYFCPTCGILPFRRPRLAPHAWAVNARCLDDVDLDAIPVKRVHGKLLP